jgi:hypothetical protein
MAKAQSGGHNAGASADPRPPNRSPRFVALASVLHESERLSRLVDNVRPIEVRPHWIPHSGR